MDAETEALRNLDNRYGAVFHTVGVDADSPSKGGTLPMAWLDSAGKVRGDLADSVVYRHYADTLSMRFHNLVVREFRFRVSAVGCGLHLRVRATRIPGDLLLATEAFYLRECLGDDPKRRRYDIVRAANSPFYVEGVLFDAKFDAEGRPHYAGPWRNGLGRPASGDSLPSGL